MLGENQLLLSFDEFQELNHELNFFRKEDEDLFYRSLSIGKYDIVMMLLYRRLSVMNIVGLSHGDKEAKDIIFKDFKIDHRTTSFIFNARLDDFIISSKVIDSSKSILLSDFLRINNEDESLVLANENKIITKLALEANNRLDDFISNLEDSIGRYYQISKKESLSSEELALLFDMFVFSKLIEVSNTSNERVLQVQRRLKDILKVKEDVLKACIKFIRSALNALPIFSRMHLFTLGYQDQVGYELVIKKLRSIGNFEFLRLLDIIPEKISGSDNPYIS